MRISDWSSDVCSSDLDISAQTDSRNWPAADRPRARRTSADGRERAGRRLGTFPNRPARTAQRPGRRRRTEQRIQRVLDGLCEWLVPIACLDLHLGTRTDPPDRYRATALRADQHGGCRGRASLRAGPAALRPQHAAGVRYRVECTRSEEHTSELQSLLRISY